MVSYNWKSIVSNYMSCLNPCCSGQWSRTRITHCYDRLSNTVLILVVVDNGLVHWHTGSTEYLLRVLILVVVDNGLVPTAVLAAVNASKSLNPCCSGQWSRTTTIYSHSKLITSLNPCCSGQWSRTATCLSSSWL